MGMATCVTHRIEPEKTMAATATRVEMSRVPDGSSGTFWTVATVYEGNTKLAEHVLEIGIFTRESFREAAALAKKLGLPHFYDAITTQGLIMSDLF